MSIKTKVTINEDELVDAECLSCGESYEEELFECLQCGSDEVAANTSHEDTYCTFCQMHHFDIWDNTYTVEVRDTSKISIDVYRDVCGGCIDKIKALYG